MSGHQQSGQVNRKGVTNEQVYSFSNASRARWHTPIIQSLGEAETGGFHVAHLKFCYEDLPCDKCLNCNVDKNAGRFHVVLAF